MKQSVDQFRDSHQVKKNAGEESKSISQRKPLVFDTLNKEALMSENLDMKLFEGKIFICWKGTTTKYVTRWAEISKRCFSYYKDRLSTIRQNAKPLGSILLSEMQKVQLFPEDTKEPKYYLFGISLKNQESPTHVRRHTIQQFENTNHEKEEEIMLSQMASTSFKSHQQSQKIVQQKIPHQFFALESRDERDKWVTVIEWLIKLYKAS